MGEYFLKCLKCSGLVEGFAPRCACGGAVETFYDLSNAVVRKTKDYFDPFDVFFDILPIRERTHILASSNSPTRLIHSKKIGEKTGLKNLYLKVEGDLPTGTTKDRMASVSLSFLKENAVSDFVLATTGNTGAAYAYGAKLHPFFRIHIFFYGAGARLASGLSEEVFFYQTKNNFDSCSRIAKDFSEKNGIVWEGGFFNPARRDGLKLAYAEAVVQSNLCFDSYFQSVSSGMGILGTFKGANELVELGVLDHAPKMHPVQEDTCSPMVNAFLEKSGTIRPRHIVSSPAGICKAILRGNPSSSYPYVLDCVKKSRGNFEKVSEVEIRQAMNLLRICEGLLVGEEGGAALAGAIKARCDGKVDEDELLLVNLSSGKLRLRSPPTTFRSL